METILLGNSSAQTWGKEKSWNIIWHVDAMTISNGTIQSLFVTKDFKVHRNTEAGEDLVKTICWFPG